MEGLQNVLQQLARMQWSDYLDILLVTILVYMIMPMFRSSGASRIAKAVFALLVLSGLTSALELYALNFLLSQVMAVGLVAIVVLFQPELRRMLDHLGAFRMQKLLGVERPSQEMEGVIRQVVAACEIMSQERVGALMVFERDNPLDEHMKAGTHIDAQVSEQLIRNIFFPKAALHDGAMILRGGRVTAAGCVLPLSESKRLSADLGTRHRAGVGMSEVSDAVVVIVSEETGAISVAVGGILKRHLAPQTLERLLRNELCPDIGGGSDNPMQKLLQKLQKKGKGE